MSALYGAAGVRYDPELTRALLDAGANPNDGESVYHSTEAESPECLRILLEHGAADERHERAGARARQRAAGARPAAARARHRSERGRMRGARRQARPRAGDDRASRVARGRCRPAGRRDLAWRRAAADAVPARRPAREGRARGGARASWALRPMLTRPTPRSPRSRAASGRPRRSRRRSIPTRRRCSSSRHCAASSTSCSTSSGRSSAALSADRRQGRCSTTPPGSARSRTSSGCSSGAPTPWRVRSLRDAARLGGTRLAGLRDPDGDHVGVAERLVAAGAQIEPRFLELADGPLAEWLQSRSIASPNE